MADTVAILDVDVTQNEADALWGPYWVSTLKGAFIAIEAGDIYAVYTTDGGANWSTSALGAHTVNRVNAFFDREIPNATGTNIHVAGADPASDLVRYGAFDVDAGTWGTEITVAHNFSLTAADNIVFVTSGKAGHIVVGAVTSGAASGCWEVSAGTLSSIANPWETNAADRAMGAYCDTDDDADVAIWFWDISADEITIKVYDDSADAWNESTTGALSAADSTIYRQWSQATRHSDGAALIAVWNALDAIGADLLTAECVITSSSAGGNTITAKTNALSNTVEAAQSGIFIDQTTDDVYVCFFLATTTWNANVHVYYTKSTDDMATWGGQVQYDEDAADDHRGLGVGGFSSADGGRFMPVWFNDDLNDIYTNLTNDIEVAVAAAATPRNLAMMGVGT